MKVLTEYVFGFNLAETALLQGFLRKPAAWEIMAEFLNGGRPKGSL
jgi:hypothetical protein